MSYPWTTGSCLFFARPSGDAADDMDGAQSYALQNAYCTIRLGCGDYTFRRAPKPILGNIRLQGVSREMTNFVRAFNQGSDTFLDVSQGGGLRDIGILAGPNTSGGVLVKAQLSDTGGYHDFQRVEVSYRPGGSARGFFHLDGSGALDGLRSVTMDHVQVFGDLFIDHVVNIGGAGNWCGPLTIRSSAPGKPTTSPVLSFKACGPINLDNAWHCNLSVGFMQAVPGAVTLGANARGMLSIGSAINASHIVRAPGSGVRVMTPVYDSLLG